MLCDAGCDLNVYLSDLAPAWQAVFDEHWWMALEDTEITPFAFILIISLHAWEVYTPSESSCGEISSVLDAVTKLWVNTLHKSGIDLVAYATHEESLIEAILMRSTSKWAGAFRFSCGPDPDDWRIETGPPGEAYVAYFWRSIETAPVGEELAAKVLDLIHRRDYPDIVQCDVPGGWQTRRDNLEHPTWNVYGWLAYMVDIDVAPVEMDLEQLEDEEFYEEWDLSFVIKDWP